MKLSYTDDVIFSSKRGVGWSTTWWWVLILVFRMGVTSDRWRNATG